MAQPGHVRLGDRSLEQTELVRTEIRQALNDHWWCTIECRDTHGAPIQAHEILGKDCQIANVDELGETTVAFDGVFVDVAVKREVWGTYTAVLQAASRSWLLDQSPRMAYFGTASIETVASAVAGVAGVAAAVSLPEKDRPTEYVQANETDWRFLLRLADDHGGWIRSLGDLELRNTFDAPVTLTLRGEQSLLEFAVEGHLLPFETAGTQYERGIAQSKTLTAQQKAPQWESAAGRMGAAALAGAQQNKLSAGVQRSRAITLGDHQTLLTAEAERAQGSAVMASGVSRSPGVQAGRSVEIANLGDASGTYHVVEATHVWTVQGYENHFRATPWKTWRSPVRPPMRRAAGLMLGAVTGNYDPTGRGRLEVQPMWQSTPSQLAPLASVMAGAGMGLVLFPEIGDEVVVSFSDGDPERPVILGSLWNGKHQPPRQDFRGGDAKPNQVKRLVTKSGIRITISDKPGEESIALATPRGARMLLTEKADETGRPAISFYTLGDIVLEAGNRIHRQAAQHSRHVDGKVMKHVSVKLTDWWGNPKPYQDVTLVATLTDGKSFQAPVQTGQHFPGIPEGANKFSFPNFYDTQSDDE